MSYSAKSGIQRNRGIPLNQVIPLKQVIPLNQVIPQSPDIPHFLYSACIPQSPVSHATLTSILKCRF